MEDWYQLAQSIIFGLIFAYLLAKLISILVAFKDNNLSLTRRHDDDDDETRSENQHRRRFESSITGETDSLIAEQGSLRGDEEEDEDDDWEGVESTELEEAFSAATAFVAAAASDRLSKKVSNDTQLELYGLYKIANEGPCSSPQPSALKITARAKWQAWKKLGAMPPEEAMEKYIELVTRLFPAWVDGGSRRGKRSNDPSGSSSRAPMGPVFSSLVYEEEESENELKIDEVHAFAREGEVEKLLKCIENGIPVNARGYEGRTPLHWAIDRGHFDVAKALVDKNADVNAKDNEGQTSLHYAVVCEREALAEFLVKQKADTTIKDEDGNSPFDLCESEWSCMRENRDSS
ncbi:unnamed protein product [Cochlearia groenlandica]